MIIDAINQARQEGANDDQILNEVVKQNPQLQHSYDSARQLGADSKTILDEIVRQNSSSSTSTPTTKEPGLLTKIGQNILKPFAQTGVAAYNVGKSAYDLITGKSQEAAQDIGASRELPFMGQTEPVLKGNETPLETGKKTLGTALQIGTTVSPIGEGSLLAKVGQFGASGIGNEVGRELNSGENLNPGNIVTSGVVGAALPVGGAAVSKILENVPKNAWSFLLKPTAKMLTKNPDLAQQAADTGIVALTKQGIIKEAQNNIQQIEVSLDDLLGKSEGKINAQTLADHLNALKDQYSKIPGEQNAVDTIANIQKETVAKGDLSLAEANDLKRTIYQKIANSYGKGTLEIPSKTEAQKVLASGIKQEIEKQIPEVKGLNAKQAVYIQVKKAIDRVDKLSQGKGIAGSGIGIYDLLTGITGSAAGGPMVGAGATVGKKILESPGFITSAAKIADMFNNISPTKKLLMYNALKVLTQSIKN